jgi:hypothetical protein
MDPGSAAHQHSASKTRVNALMVLRSIRGRNAATDSNFKQQHSPKAQLRDLAAQVARVLLLTSPPQRKEGAGNAGRSDSARSLVCETKKAHKHSHHGHAENTRHSPRNGFNGFLRALPGESGFLVTVAGGNLSPPT